ncbi:rCG55746 [Rattus norvegicus]|uniref:RCG55746 n=1 Tax=Rattus norvegicus TaxID=10116 RepID=A6JLN1_RAT|nr:rCG55746 [Rattus norvegicus]
MTLDFLCFKVLGLHMCVNTSGLRAAAIEPRTSSIRVRDSTNCPSFQALAWCTTQSTPASGSILHMASANPRVDGTSAFWLQS